MENYKTDEIDLKILRILQTKPDLNINDIGEKVGLSHTPCWRRIKKMQEKGILKSRLWQIDGDKIGLDVSIFVYVALSELSTKALESFEAATLDIPEILQCYTLSGEFDYVLRVVVPNVKAYERTVKGKLLKLPNVGKMNSHFALNEIKNTNSLPI